MKFSGLSVFWRGLLGEYEGGDQGLLLETNGASNGGVKRRETIREGGPKSMAAGLISVHFQAGRRP